MNPGADLLSRREALARVAMVLGGTLSASTIAGVLAGCAAPAAAAGGVAWLPRTLSVDQAETLLVIGEIILPETDTPGARTARVDRFIDAMLTDFYPEEPRRRFLAGLARAEARARRELGGEILRLAPERQTELVVALNRAAYAESPPAGEWAPEDVGRQAWFRTLKELVLVGYYTSEAGATRELRVNPMGVWRADIPYSDVGSAWA